MSNLPEFAQIRIFCRSLGISHQPSPRFQIKFSANSFRLTFLGLSSRRPARKRNASMKTFLLSTFSSNKGHSAEIGLFIIKMHFGEFIDKYVGAFILRPL
jgi:hypothetical protein